MWLKQIFYDYARHTHTKATRKHSWFCDMLWTGLSGEFKAHWGVRCFRPVQTCPGLCSLLYNGLPGLFPGGKVARVWCWSVTLFYHQGWVWVELYPYLPCVLAWHVTGHSLPLCIHTYTRSRYIQVKVSDFFILNGVLIDSIWYIVDSELHNFTGICKLLSSDELNTGYLH